MRSRFWGSLWLGAFAIFFGGCSVNILSNFANKDTNEAHFVTATQKINAGDYVGALEEIAKMDAKFLATDRAKLLQAEAYGGLCGLDFLDFALSFKEMGSTRLFPFLLASFKTGTTANVDNCIEAEGYMTSIGTASERTKNQNTFMTMLELAKIGNILAHYADTNNDGTVNASYNPCTVGGGTRAAGPLDDSDVKEIGSAMGNAILSLTAAGGGSGTGADAIADISALCTSLGGAANFCSVTTASSVTATQVLGIRTLLKESSSVGLGSNCTGDITACHCP
jgi:hypothetical protein